LKDLRYSVLALGDSNYAKFCECGKNFDRRLEELGATRIHGRVDCDVDFESGFVGWLEGALKGFASPPKSPNSRTNPHPAPLMTNYKLNGAGSSKDTRHFELRLEGSTLDYDVGDALGVYPTNCPELVEELLQVLDHAKDDGLREALLKGYEITKIPHP